MFGFMDSLVVMMRAQGNRVMTGKHSLEERKNTSKQWGSLATSGHSASFSLAEELTTETAGSGHFTCNKDDSAD